MREPDSLLHRKKQRKILNTLQFRPLPFRPRPFRAKLLLMVINSISEAEQVFQHEHRVWWLDEWGKRVCIDMRESAFSPHFVWEYELQRIFLRDLELLGS